MNCNQRHQTLFSHLLSILLNDIIQPTNHVKFTTTAQLTELVMKWYRATNPRNTKQKSGNRFWPQIICDVVVNTESITSRCYFWILDNETFICSGTFHIIIQVRYGGRITCTRRIENM